MDTVAHAGARFLEILFFTGLAGSSLVVLISFVEDLQELFHKDSDDEVHTPTAA